MVHVVMLFGFHTKQVILSKSLAHQIRVAGAKSIGQS